MQRLFLFLYQYRAFLTFLFLEIICIWLIIENNRYQGAKFFNSSNHIAAALLQSSDNITDYFNLSKVNKRLAEENAVLKEKLERAHQAFYNRNRTHLTDTTAVDSLLVYQDSTMIHLDSLSIQDSVVISKYRFLSAKVINNSIRRFNNFITINKGELDGVEPGMGVVDNDGVVGKVKAASKHFAVITSILHGEMLVSAKIKRTGDLATVKWDGIDPYTSQLKYIPRHVKPQVNDTIVTSGYNAIFPEGIPIGFIKEVEIPDDATFYNITIALASDLNQLSYVYLIKNTLLAEQDSLETTNSKSF